MPLKQVQISSIKPFDHIDCPVCGAKDFTEVVYGGGITCDRCGAKFSLRSTGGDAGCVVDCHLYDVWGGWRLALKALGFYILTDRYPFNSDEPAVYLYRVMKCPMEDGSSGEGSGWILNSRNLQPDRMLWADKNARRPIWEYQHQPLLTEGMAKIASDAQK